jgi:hypothetical protein
VRLLLAFTLAFTATAWDRASLDFLNHGGLSNASLLLWPDSLPSL